MKAVSAPLLAALFLLSVAGCAPVPNAIAEPETVTRDFSVESESGTVAIVNESRGDEIVAGGGEVAADSVASLRDHCGDLDEPVIVLWEAGR